MTTQRCTHGTPMATWCDQCSADFTIRVSPDCADYHDRATDWGRAGRERSAAVIVWVLVAALIWALVAALVWAVSSRG